MQIRQNVQLAQYTTFQIGGPARYFCSVKNKEDLVEAINFAKDNNLSIFILGKGSNLLVSDTGFSGLVIKNEIMGVDFKEEKDGIVFVKAGAGETWDDLVDDCVAKNFQGIENLSAIPGTVGAAPVQNIGAYGTEFCDVFVSVDAFDTKKMEFIQLSEVECKFGYRDSVFKQEKGRYVITHVLMKLTSNGKTNISYKDLKNYFSGNSSLLGSEVNLNPSIKQVRDAVIVIRLNKLPDWTHWGTAGSFFKNPVISREHFEELSIKYPGLPGFPIVDGKIKVALGWILDNVCNVKGMCIDNVCTYEKQALVIVTHTGATASGVVKLSQELMKMVKDKTGIEIEGEVEWVC